MLCSPGHTAVEHGGGGGGNFKKQDKIKAVIKIAEQAFFEKIGL